MKKLVLVTVCMLIMASANAAGRKSNKADRKQDTKEMTQRLDVDKVTNALHLNEYQAGYVEDFGEVMNQELEAAAKCPQAEMSEKVEGAVMRNLYNVKKVLSRSQYARYELIVNATVENRGLSLRSLALLK